MLNQSNFVSNSISELSGITTNAPPKFPNGMATWEMIGKSVFILVVINVGVFWNLCLVLAVIKNRELHNPTFFFLLNLSLGDLVRSVVCLPFYLVAIISQAEESNGHFCKSAIFFYSLLAYETLFTLFPLAIARYSIIAHHQCHQKKLTSMVCLSIISMTWTVAIIMAIPPIFRLGSSKSPLPSGSFDEDVCSFRRSFFLPSETLGFIIVFTVFIIVVLVVYLRTFIFMRTHRKMNPARRPPAMSDNWTFFGPGALPVIPNSQSQFFQVAIVQGVPGHRAMGNTETYVTIADFQTEEKVTRMSFVLTLCITLLWLPYILVTYLGLIDEDLLSQPMALGAMFITFLQCTVTPVVCMTIFPPLSEVVKHVRSICLLPSFRNCRWNQFQWRNEQRGTRSRFTCKNNHLENINTSV